MASGQISMARHHVLGDLHERCGPISGEVPVYLNDEGLTRVGHVDEALGHYADAYTFYLADDICKRLSAGQFLYSFELKPADPTDRMPTSKVSLVCVILNIRKGYDKPLPRRAKPVVEAAAKDAE